MRRRGALRSRRRALRQRAGLLRCSLHAAQLDAHRGLQRLRLLACLRQARLHVAGHLLAHLRRQSLRFAHAPLLHQQQLLPKPFQVMRELGQRWERLAVQCRLARLCARLGAGRRRRRRRRRRRFGGHLRCCGCRSLVRMPGQLRDRHLQPRLHGRRQGCGRVAHASLHRRFHVRGGHGSSLLRHLFASALHLGRGGSGGSGGDGSSGSACRVHDRGSCLALHATAASALGRRVRRRLQLLHRRPARKSVHRRVPRRRRAAPHIRQVTVRRHRVRAARRPALPIQERVHLALEPSAR
mmetsp:Transcript_16825/g.53816  ORF Transcript_16825/g.53816 Transcript_16825/m.53816 type:complete len:297 (-) Transcript_16825:71-961(-)